MKVRKSFIIGIIITLLLLFGAVVAYYLAQHNQDVRQHAAEPTSGAFGKALEFDGTTTVVSTQQKIHLYPPFTIEGWIKPEYSSDLIPETLFSSDILTPASDRDQNCSSSINSTLVPANTLEPSSTTYQASFTVSNPVQTEAQTVLSPTSIPYGEWTHIAMTVQGQTITMFINGKRVDEKSLPHPICVDSVISIGSEQNGDLGSPSTFKNAYKGQLDEIRISKSVRYTNDFIPSSEPFTIDPDTTALAHLDGSLKDEFSGLDASGQGSLTYVDSTLPTSTTPPACQANVSTCSWDPVDSAVSYHYTVTEEGKDTPIADGDVQAPLTSTTFVSEADKIYTCSVTATNACGTGEKGSATASCTVPTATPTPIPSATPIPTNTPTPLPTNTPTPLPTNTPIPPTNTPVPPLATVVPPTATPVPPTPTGIPPVIIATNTPTPTLPSPGSPIETVTIAGGILLTIVGALILFAL